MPSNNSNNNNANKKTQKKRARRPRSKGGVVDTNPPPPLPAESESTTKTFDVYFDAPKLDAFELKKLSLDPSNYKGTRGATHFSMYGKYKLKSVGILYEKTGDYTTKGSIGVYYTPDEKQAAPASSAEMLTATGTAAGANLKFNNKYNNFWVPTGVIKNKAEGYAAGEEDTPGVILIGMTSTSPDPAPGLFKVRLCYNFFGPKPPAKVLGPDVITDKPHPYTYVASKLPTDYTAPTDASWLSLESLLNTVYPPDKDGDLFRRTGTYFTINGTWGKSSTISNADFADFLLYNLTPEEWTEVIKSPLKTITIEEPPAKYPLSRLVRTDLGSHTTTLEDSVTTTLPASETTTLPKSQTTTLPESQTTTLEGSKTTTLEDSQTTTLPASQTTTLPESQTTTLTGSLVTTESGSHTITDTGSVVKTESGSKTTIDNDKINVEIVAPLPLPVGEKKGFLATLFDIGTGIASLLLAEDEQSYTVLKDGVFTRVPKDTSKIPVDAVLTIPCVSDGSIANTPTSVVVANTPLPVTGAGGGSSTAVPPEEAFQNCKIDFLDWQGTSSRDDLETLLSCYFEGQFDGTFPEDTRISLTGILRTGKPGSHQYYTGIVAYGKSNIGTYYVDLPYALESRTGRLKLTDTINVAMPID